MAGTRSSYCQATTSTQSVASLAKNLGSHPSSWGSSTRAVAARWAAAVNRYLATTYNDADNGFLHLTAGACINIRFTQRENRTIDTRAYCYFKDKDGDKLFAEYITGAPMPAKAITIAWTFVSGTGKI